MGQRSSWDAYYIAPDAEAAKKEERCNLLKLKSKRKDDGDLCL